MSHRFRQFSLDDRRTIYQLIEARTPVRVVAARLGDNVGAALARAFAALVAVAVDHVVDKPSTMPRGG